MYIFKLRYTIQYFLLLKENYGLLGIYYLGFSFVSFTLGSASYDNTVLTKVTVKTGHSAILLKVGKKMISQTIIKTLSPRNSVYI